MRSDRFDWAPERRALIDVAFGLARFLGVCLFGAVVLVLVLHAWLAIAGGGAR